LVRTLSVGAALASVLAASSCSHQDAHNPATITRPDGIINGTLILESSMASSLPGTTVVFNGPGRGRLEVVSAGQLVASVITGPTGGFRVRVPAGRYQFHLAESRKLCATDTPPAPVTFTVRPGRANRVQVFCASPFWPK
jgi:hypothetical protein